MSQVYALCEIAKNNGKSGKPVWVIVKGVVYDVTKFLKEHPGGDDSILEYAGKDATKAFNEVGHSTDAIRELKLYKIGVVASECTQFVATTQPKSVLAATTITTEKQPPQQQQPSEQCCRAQKKEYKLFCCC